MAASDTVMLLGHSVPVDAVITGATGILGAILGSVVTVVWTEFFNARVRRRERKGKQAVGSFAMYHKLNRVLSTAELLRRHLKQSIDEAVAADVPFITMRVMPVSQLNEDFQFATDELWVMIQVGGHELMNKVQSLGRANNATIVNPLKNVYPVDYSFTIRAKVLSGRVRKFDFFLREISTPKVRV